MKTRIALLAVAMALIVSFDAYGCGDSLYRVGKGVAYRTYAAPLPGNLLVYAETEYEKQMAAELADSGHDVDLVSNAEELEAALELGGYDVVIAPYSERATIESAASSVEYANASYVPVTATDHEKKLARQSYDSALESGDNIKRYLKAIHRELKKNA